MGLFSKRDYDKAVAALADGSRQLELDGRCCTICGDTDHGAEECGHNPLVAMRTCQDLADSSYELHRLLHWLAGYDSSLGVQQGPARVVPIRGQALERLERIAEIIEAVDRRCAAVDGPVTSTLQEMEQHELSTIYALARGEVLV